MNQTTNFNFKLYEGTDLFNPLTVENVNFEDVDTNLKAVSDAAVGTATELLTNTVHALSRNDPDRNVIIFTATSNYDAGETFTVDGVQVTALTPDGSTLATGCYIIGSEVLAILKGTLLTVYVGASKAKDSDKLDGHDSTYFATASDLTDLDNDVDAIATKVGTAVLDTTAPDLSGAVNELNNNLTKRSGFIDPSRLEAHITTQNGSYLATQDCWVVGSMHSSNEGQAQVSLDSVVVAKVGSDQTKDVFVSFPVMKGQLVATRATYGVYDLYLRPMI